eukprot:201951_1
MFDTLLYCENKAFFLHTSETVMSESGCTMRTNADCYIPQFYQIRKGKKERKVHRNALSHGLSGRLRGVEYTYLFHDKCRDQGKREYMEMYTSTSRGKNEEVLRVFYYKKKNKKYTEYMMIDKEQLSDYVAYKRETKPKWNAGHLEYGTRVFWKYCINSKGEFVHLVEWRLHSYYRHKLVQKEMI